MKTTDKNNRRKVAIWAITPGGLRVGTILARAFESNDTDQDHSDQIRNSPSSSCPTLTRNDGQAGDFFVSEKLLSLAGSPSGAKKFKTLARAVEERFQNYSAHIFIFSTGIAVRIIARLLDSKIHDPAVVVVDDRGINAISLVSGHLGGANDLAHRVGEIINARPVITTATDVNQLPAIDLIARDHNLFIENPSAIKHVNMAFLQGKPVEILDPLGLVFPHLPEGLAILKSCTPGQNRAAVVCTDTQTNVPRGTLVLRPPTLAVGIGCNRKTSMDEIQAFLTLVFQERCLSSSSVFTLATTEVKHDEQGILSLAKILGLGIQFYDKPSLNSVTTIENPSAMVEKHLGVKSVCEASAILASNNGQLIVPKMKKGNVTLAVARRATGCL